MLCVLGGGGGLTFTGSCKEEIVMAILQVCVCAVCVGGGASRYRNGIFAGVCMLCLCCVCCCVCAVCVCCCVCAVCAVSFVTDLILAL